MSRLALVLFAIVATSLMGSLVTFSLAIGYDTFKPIIISAITGFFLAIPISNYVAGKITHLQKN